MSSFNDNYDVLAIGVSTTIGPDQNEYPLEVLLLKIILVNNIKEQ